MQGQVWLLNVWASWCVACRQEHPLLVELARRKAVPIVGLNYKDKPDAAKGWLAQWGNPYDLSVKDLDGRVGIEYRRVRRARDVPDRQERRDPLQADRPDHRRGVDEEDAADDRGAAPVMKRLLALLMLALPLAVLAADATPTDLDPVSAKRAVDISAQLRCLVCQNQSIAESNAELAVDLRRQVNEQIKAGKSDREIVDFMVDRYGDFVLYKPPFNMTTLLLWLGPLVLGVLAVVAFVRTLRARNRAIVERPLTDAERVEAERLLSQVSKEQR